MSSVMEYKGYYTNVILDTDTMIVFSVFSE